MESLPGRTRPGDLRLHLQPDTNAGPNQVQALLDNYRHRQMKLPKSRGRFDVDSFQDHGNRGFVKYNGDTLAPCRDNVPIKDPTSNLMSAGGDVDRNTGVAAIGTLQQAGVTPNMVTPQRPKPITTVEHRCRDISKSERSEPGPLSRSLPAPLSDPQLEKTQMVNDPGTWNGRRISHALLSANLHKKYAAKQDPLFVKREQGSFGHWEVGGQTEENGPGWKQQASLRYCYTSATQRSYEDVDWDRKLPPKVLPPATTLEKHPRPVSHHLNGEKRYDPSAHYWQNLGRSWDTTQSRNGFHTRGPIAFCSPNKLNEQIPGYDGFVGGFGERDHPQQAFLSSAVLRTDKPKYTDTACRPNIPGYTGCIQPDSNLPANANVPLPLPQTTARTHRYFPLSRKGSPHKHVAPMSKMVTLVPPCNPFNRVDPSSRSVEQFS